MAPTLVDGDRVLLRPLKKKTVHAGDTPVVMWTEREMQRGDIVIYENATGTLQGLVGRVVGGPGEMVQIRDGAVVIDNVVYMEAGAQRIQERGVFAYPRKLGKDEYFILGDNRKKAIDSRDPRVGPVRSDRIYGRCDGCITPWKVRSLRRRER